MAAEAPPKASDYLVDLIAFLRSTFAVFTHLPVSLAQEERAGGRRGSAGPPGHLEGQAEASALPSTRLSFGCPSALDCPEALGEREASLLSPIPLAAPFLSPLGQKAGARDWWD